MRQKHKCGNRQDISAHDKVLKPDKLVTVIDHLHNITDTNAYNCAYILKMSLTSAARYQILPNAKVNISIPCHKTKCANSILIITSTIVEIILYFL